MRKIPPVPSKRGFCRERIHPSSQRVQVLSMLGNSILRWQRVSRHHRGAVVAFACLLLVLAARQSDALVVAVTDTTVNPATYSGWTKGDPGWENVTVSGSNYVYLGDRWVLSARHVGVSDANFSTGTFTPVAGEDYVIHNPPPSLAGGLTLTTETDLRLIRLSADPGLPALTIASQSPPASGTSGSEVMIVGRGPSRLASETHWQVDTSNANSWIWTEVASGGNFHGYKSTTPSVKLWGTNRLANPNSATYQPAFKYTLNSTTAVVSLKSGTVTRDILTLFSSYERQGDAGALPYEAQAVTGDSGSAVFYKNGNQWVLAGVVNLTLIYNNQPSSAAIYTDGTTFADLSYYNKAYQGSICDVMKTCGNYSLVGDVNVDGVVSGDGTGSASVDDVSAFIAGWNFNNGAPHGDYDSWTHGDMNLDGRTDVTDFFMLRNALHGGIAAGALTQLFGSSVPSDLFGGVVPEPGMMALAAWAFLPLAASRRRRVPSSAS